MGNIRSTHFDEKHDDIWWPKDESNIKSLASQNFTRFSSADATAGGLKEISVKHKEELDEFQLEFSRKREKRREILTQKRKEMEDLREQVDRLKKENEKLKNACDHSGEKEEIIRLKQKIKLLEERNGENSEYEINLLRNENEELKIILVEKTNLLADSESIIETNRELKISISNLQKELQNMNAKVLDFEKEKQDYNTHVVALKDVISVSKHMLQIRESQLKELKDKVDSIEESLAGREMHVLSQDLRNEYERQLANIRSLRTLYEERQRAEKREKEELRSQLDDTNKELEMEQKKNSELLERISMLENDKSKNYDEIKVLESNLGLSKAECRQYRAELAVINQLFSEILLGYNSTQEIDLNKLQKHLVEHHDLLQDIVVNEVSSEVSYALPKVLLDLLNQVNASEETEASNINLANIQLETIQEESENTSTIHHQMNSAEEIVENLPKVWRVLIELLSHQTAPVNTLSDEENENPCYKTVQTPKGPSLVLSVSQTFIRLKDLILEKKSLEKETNHLKQLNGHLENRLQDQEKRLEMVQSELSKTWLVVGKLQKQHQLLHTQEKILRYELAQKRKLLTELREQLEYSREKWAQAREKNSNTEVQWRQLRNEFASRKVTIINDDPNNGVESGYSDDRECSSSDEEPGYEADVSECSQKNPNENMYDTKEDISHLSGDRTDNLIPNEIAVGLNDSQTEEIVHIGNEYEAVTHPVLQSEVMSEIEGNNKVECLYLMEQKTDAVQNDNEKTNVTDYFSNNTNAVERLETDSFSRASTSRDIPGNIENDDTVTSTETPSCISEEAVCDTAEKLQFLSKSSNQDYLKEPNNEYNEMFLSEADVTQHNTPNNLISSEKVKINGNLLDKITESKLNILESEKNPQGELLDKTNSLQDKEFNIKSRDIQGNTITKSSETIIVKSQVVQSHLPSTSHEFNNKSALDEITLKDLSDCAKHRTSEDQLNENIETTEENLEKYVVDKLGTVQEPEQKSADEVLNNHFATQPSSSQNENSRLTIDEVLAKRDERLRRLEGQCEQLVTKVTNTTNKSVVIANRLDNLHEMYGQNCENANSEIADSSENLETIDQNSAECVPSAENGIVDRNLDA